MISYQLVQLEYSMSYITVVKQISQNLWLKHFHHGTISTLWFWLPTITSSSVYILIEEHWVRTPPTPVCTPCLWGSCSQTRWKVPSSPESSHHHHHCQEQQKLQNQWDLSLHHWGSDAGFPGQHSSLSGTRGNDSLCIKSEWVEGKQISVSTVLSCQTCMPYYSGEWQVCCVYQALL